MGNEQSNNSDKKKEGRGLAPDEVVRMLDEQRRAYEEKIKKIKANTPNVTVHVTKESKENGADRVLQQQIRDLQNLVLNNPSSSSARRSPVANSMPGPSSSQSASMERSRTPYSYCKEDLKNVAQSLQCQNSLYPNLGKASTLSGVGLSPNTQSSVKVNENRDGFVYVQTPKFLPSAPPAPSASAPSIRQMTGPENVRAAPKSSPGPKSNDLELNCQTCRNPHGLTIFQCPSGHSSCRDCRMSGAKWGKCGLNITDMRNITLEALVCEKRVPCPNAADGCCLILKFADIDTHLKECPYNEIHCPMNALEYCGWRGKISQMASHFDTFHPERRSAKVDTEMYIPSLNTNKHYAYLVDELGNYMFLVHLKVDVQRNMVYMAVQLMGTVVSASKWKYEIHIYNKRESRRKYCYSDICESHSRPIDEIFGESKCMVLPMCQARTFYNEGNLTFKFYITKDYDRGQSENQRGRGRRRGRGLGRGGRGAWMA